MTQQKKILQVATIMNQGGAETMVMNYYRALDKTAFQFDFLVNRQERGVYDDEIESMGAHIYRAFSLRPGHYLKYFRFLNRFFREHAHEYVAIHCHIQENSHIVLHYAKKYGIPNRLMTSHTAFANFDLKLPFRYFARLYSGSENIRLSCGQKAGVYAYGKKDFIIFPNAIDAHDFTFSPTRRAAFRAAHGWKDDTLVIGLVARFSPQKNHEFLLRIFAEVHRRNAKALLVLVGDGDLRPQIEAQIRSLHLQDAVSLEGTHSNISDYLQAFDLFLMPSHYEGLPVSVIEAQAAGLRCLLSDVIDPTTDVTGDISFLPLSSGAVKWAEKLLSLVPYEHQDNTQKVCDAGYDVKTQVKRLTDLYTTYE